jgi:hypothetical protein
MSTRVFVTTTLEFTNLAILHCVRHCIIGGNNSVVK